MNFSKMSIIVLLSVVSIGCFPDLERKVIVERERVKFDIPTDKIKKVTLSNGMTVLVYQTKHVPKVLVQIAYNIGSDIEESGERGLAHLIEHMIFKGTKRLSEGDIESIARKYGAKMNAWTGKETTSYFFEVNKNNWKPFVDILADCMLNARFEQQHLNSEMKAVIQELRMSKDNYMRWMFNKMCELLFPANHPYHYPIIGYKEDLLNLSAQRLKNFYGKYYHPHNAVLFIAGDVDIDEAVAIAKKNFDKIPSGKVKKEKLLPQDEIEIANQVSRVYEDVKKESQCFYWKLPGLKSGAKIVSSIVAGVFGGGEGSILYRRLVEKDKIAMDVGAGAELLRDAGIFYISVVPKEGCREKCRKAVQEELEKVIKNGVDDDALLKIIRQKERHFLGMFENTSELTYEWIQSFFATGDEFEVFKYLDQFYQVDEEMVQKFTKDHIDPMLINELNVLPLPKEKRGRWLENKKRSEEMDAKILQKFVRTLPLETPRFALTIPDPNPLQFAFPKPDKTITLKNGLKIILKKSKHVPMLQAMCQFKDSQFFSKSQEGQSLDVMMNSLMEGSENFSKKNNVDFFELYGAGYAFGANGAALSVANVGYKPVLERMFQVLTKPKFEKSALEKIKAIYVDSYQRCKDDPGKVATRLLMSMAYRNHPFGYTFDEVIDSVKKLTVNDLYALHKKYVSPDNMLLVLVGDFDEVELEKTVTEVFGGWDGMPYVDQKVKNGNFLPGEKKDHVMLRDQVCLLLGQPSPINIYSPDRLPLQLLNFISFFSMGSRIYQLRERTGLFYTAGGSFGEGATKIYGVDYIFALLSVDKVEPAEKKIKALVDVIRENGVNQNELEAARKWYEKGLIDLISSNGAVADTFGMLEEFGLGFDYYDKRLKRVQDMTVGDMKEICKKYAITDKMARIRVGRV
jgi:zinc protease